MIPDALRAPEIRAEGREKVTGTARYAADVTRPGMLHAAFVGSPFAHAKVLDVDVSAARSMPGVRAVLTGSDVRPLRFGRRLQDWPILAWDRVRLVGDRVAVVAADSRAQAEAAAAAIHVSYEELPAVLTIDEALRPDAPVLHPDRSAYKKVEYEVAPLGGFSGYESARGVGDPTRHPNIVGRLFHEHGDLAAGFARAARVFEHVFETQRVHNGYIEPRASLVWIDGDDVHVVSPNRRPFILRLQIGVALGLDPQRIMIEPITIGGDFGGKAMSFDEYVLVLLARATGRPVRSVMTYADELRISGTRRAARITLRTGVDPSGLITAHEARIVYNVGAYAATAANDAGFAPQSETLMAYRVPAARVEAIGVHTNTVPGGSHRAPGRQQVVFATESHVDMMARELGIDPIAFRERNLAARGEITVTGKPWPGAEMPAVLAKLREGGRLDRPLPPDNGRGVAIGVHHMRAGHDQTSVRLTLQPDGSLELVTGIPEQGTGVYTVMQRVVANELAVPAERVAIRQAGTASAPEDAGHGGSRSTVFHGGAALDAARKLKAALSDLAPGASLADAARRVAPLAVTGDADMTMHDVGAFAHLVEVAVDRATGQVRIERVLMVTDVGAVINPVALRGVLEGGFVFGLGQAIMEELAVEDGQVVNANLGDYKLPTAVDVPPIEIVAHESGNGPGPYGAKAVGELANPGAGAAVANAVADAVGVRLLSLPVTAEKVLTALSSERR